MRNFMLNDKKKPGFFRAGFKKSNSVKSCILMEGDPSLVGCLGVSCEQCSDGLYFTLVHHQKG